MSDPVVQLVSTPSAAEKAKQDCVKILRNQLNSAESGEMESVIVICRRPDSRWSFEHSQSTNFMADIGIVEIVKQRMIDTYEKSHHDHD